MLIRDEALTSPREVGAASERAVGWRLQARTPHQATIARGQSARPVPREQALDPLRRPAAPASPSRTHSSIKLPWSRRRAVGGTLSNVAPCWSRSTLQPRIEAAGVGGTPQRLARLAAPPASLRLPTTTLCTGDGATSARSRRTPFAIQEPYSRFLRSMDRGALDMQGPPRPATLPPDVPPPVYPPPRDERPRCPHPVALRRSPPLPPGGSEGARPARWLLPIASASSCSSSARRPWWSSWRRRQISAPSASRSVGFGEPRKRRPLAHHAPVASAGRQPSAHPPRGRRAAPHRAGAPLPRRNVAGPHLSARARRADQAPDGLHALALPPCCASSRRPRGPDSCPRERLMVVRESGSLQAMVIYQSADQAPHRLDPAPHAHAP